MRKRKIANMPSKYQETCCPPLDSRDRGSVMELVFSDFLDGLGLRLVIFSIFRKNKLFTRKSGARLMGLFSKSSRGLHYSVNAR